MTSPSALLDAARRRLLVHRRGLAALCVAAAAALGFQVLTDPGPTTTAVWTAARDVPSGTVLRAVDFRRTAYAVGSVPPRALHDLTRALGRTLVTPLDRGEPVSADKLLGTGRLAGYPGRAAVAVRIPDAALASLLRAGDEVDLVQADPRGAGPAHRVARDAVVLAVVDSDSTSAASTASTGRLVVFAVPVEEVDVLAAAPTAGFLTAVWNR